MNSKNDFTRERFLSFTIQDKIALATIATIFLIFGMCYHYYTPLWNPPDEERHFAYCEYIAQHRTLPAPKFTEGEINITQVIHPPLYYAIASLLYRDGRGVIQEAISFNNDPGIVAIIHPPGKNTYPYAGKVRAAHLMRFFSLALSAITVCSIYLLVLVIFPGETMLASASALFAAMNPQFLHIAASVSNENLSSVLSTIYLFALLRYLHSPGTAGHHVVTGVLLGCMLLSKLSTMFYLPLTAVIMVWVFIQNKKKLWASLAVIFCTAFLIAGWWYVRNWALTGDPLLSKFLTTTQPWAVRYSPLSFSDISVILSNTFTSFFGNLGAFQIPLPKMYLFLYGALMAGGIAGLALLPKRRKLIPFQRRALIVLFFTLMGGAGTFVSLNLKYIGTYMGRYFFPVLAPIAIGTMVGLDSLSPLRWRQTVLTLISLLLIILNAAILWWVLKPAYASTDLVEGVDQPLFSYPTPELGASVITQTFTSTEHNLCAIRVMFSSPLPMKRGEVNFFLAEGERREKVVHHLTRSLKRINDCTRYFFIFPPIENSKGKVYTFWLSTSLPSGNRFSLWYEPTDVYHDGELLIEGESSGGDLYFTTYHFTGTHPVTEWQGIKETVITQGLYIDVRELQLYYEQSREFREKTMTHEKMLRLEKAVKNRSSLLQKEH